MENMECSETTGKGLPKAFEVWKLSSLGWFPRRRILLDIYSTLSSPIRSRTGLALFEWVPRKPRPILNSEEFQFRNRPINTAKRGIGAAPVSQKYTVMWNHEPESYKSEVLMNDWKESSNIWLFVNNTGCIRIVETQTSVEYEYVPFADIYWRLYEVILPL